MTKDLKEINLSMVELKSSNIKKIGYSGGDLYVQFNSGDMYCYEGVEADVYRAFQSTDSPGKFFRGRVKGRYKDQKLGLVDADVEETVIVEEEAPEVIEPSDGVIPLGSEGPTGPEGMTTEDSAEGPVGEAGVVIAPVQQTEGTAVLPTEEEIIRAAVKSLNQEDDAHWTKEGKPNLNVLKETLGKYVSRGDVDEATDSYIRQVALQAQPDVEDAAE